MNDLTKGVVGALCSVLAVACGDDTTSSTTGGGGDGGGTTSTTTGTTSTTTGTGGDGGGTTTTTGGGGEGGSPGTGGAGGEGGTGGEGGGGTATPPDTIALELVADGMVSPLVALPVPGRSGVLAVADQIGLVHLVDEGGRIAGDPLIDLRSRIIALDPAYDERGLLGLAFHPDYVANGRVYVYYTAPLRPLGTTGYDHTNVVSELTISDGLGEIDLVSERVLLAIDHPQPNHNGGTVTFGPDGMLYVSIGDGGGANDVGPGHVDDWYDANAGGNGQDVEKNLLGSILRIDVDVDAEEGPVRRPYRIPIDNPFRLGGGLPEIWAFGFRNPFRISFDPGGDGQLFASDAGQELWEEVSVVARGGNHGWNVKEGTHCFDAENPKESPPLCPVQDPQGRTFVDPVLEYPNAKQGGLGYVVIGGHTYRGQAIPSLAGHYVFGDATRDLTVLDGSLFVAEATSDPGVLWKMSELSIADRPQGRLGEMVKSFGVDEKGELLVLASKALGPSGDTGKIYRIIPAEVSAVR